MANLTKTIVVIPARYNSSRFPGKPLAKIFARSLLERVWRIAKACSLVNDVYIATDSKNIATHAESFNAQVIMTDADCATGTDRVAQAMTQIAQKEDIVVSFQGDAVLTPPWIIDALIKEMQQDHTVLLATPAVKLTGTQLMQFIEHKKISPSSGTTVVFDKHHNAMYFSKACIPYLRNPSAQKAALYRHIGLYAYRVDLLEKLQKLEQSSLEKLEGLEQLRALENNIPLRVVEVDYQGRSHGSVDTPEDIAFVENIIAKEGELV